MNKQQKPLCIKPGISLSLFKPIWQHLKFRHLLIQRQWRFVKHETMSLSGNWNQFPRLIGKRLNTGLCPIGHIPCRIHLSMQPKSQLYPVRSFLWLAQLDWTVRCSWIDGVYLCKICLPLFPCLRVSHSSMQQIVRPLVWAVPHERFMTLLFSQSLYFLSTSILEKHNVKKRIGFFLLPRLPRDSWNRTKQNMFFLCCDNSVFSVLQYLLHLPYCFVFIQMNRMTHNIKFQVTFILPLWARRIHQQSKKHSLWHITPFLSCMLTSNYMFTHQVATVQKIFLLGLWSN